MATETQQKLQSLSDDYQKLQGELQTNISARQRLEAQQQENLGVQKEFKGLSEESNIYKMVGPVLLKQERGEATMAVDARLDFIGKEIKRVESVIKEKQEKSDGKKMEIYQIQAQAQQAQGGAQIEA